MGARWCTRIHHVPYGKATSRTPLRQASRAARYAFRKGRNVRSMCSQAACVCAAKRGIIPRFSSYEAVRFANDRAITAFAPRNLRPTRARRPALSSDRSAFSPPRHSPEAPLPHVAKPHLGETDGEAGREGAPLESSIESAVALLHSAPTRDYDSLDRVRTITYPDASLEQLDFADRSLTATRDQAALSERDHGRTTFAGTVDEPAKVTVNGQPAKMTSNDGGAPYRFEAVVNLDAGANTVVVQAKDGRNNTSTKNYSVATTGTTKTFEYDGNGNLRYEKQPNGTVIREYRWDQQNRLVRELQGAHESVYDYDGESRRVRIRELESSVQTKDDTFVWCGARICQKRNGATVVRSYFKEGFQQAAVNYFYTRDHLGSVREVVGSNGTTIGARLTFDPWGKVTESGTVLSDFGYTGHYFDRPTGLSLTWWRGYDTGLGRWLSKDPLGLRGGLNLYGYANDDPANMVDPTGREPFQPGWEGEGDVWADILCAVFGVLCRSKPDPVRDCGPDCGWIGGDPPSTSPPKPNTPPPSAPGMCTDDTPPKDDDDCVAGYVRCKHYRRYTYGNSVCGECLGICTSTGSWPW